MKRNRHQKTEYASISFGFEMSVHVEKSLLRLSISGPCGKYDVSYLEVLQTVLIGEWFCSS